VSRDAQDRGAESTQPRPTTARREALLLAAVLAATWGLLVGAPLIRGVPPAVGGVLVTVLFAAGALSAAALAACLRLTPATEALGMVLGIGLWYVVAGLGEKGGTVRVVAVPAADVIFLLACVLGGRLLSRMARERNIMLPIAIVLALADIFTVFIGPTGAILESAPEFVTRLSVKLPEMGSAAGPEGMAGLAHFATLGLGDIVFAALLLAGAARFGLNFRATFWWMLGTIAAGLALLVAIPGFPPMPVLPLMAVGFLIANRGRFELTREERRIMVIAFVFVLVLLAGLGLLTRVAVRRVAKEAAEAPPALEQPQEPGAAPPQ